MNTKHGYIGFYNRQRVEVYADGLYEAKCKVIAHFKVPKSKQGLVAVVLAERPDGTTVTQSTTEV